MKKLTFLLGFCFVLSSTSFAQMIDVDWPFCNGCKTTAPTSQEHEISVLENEIAGMLLNNGIVGIEVIVTKIDVSLSSTQAGSIPAAYNKYMLTLLSKKGKEVYSGYFYN